MSPRKLRAVLSTSGAVRRRSAFGWHRATLLRAAGAVAAAPLAQLGLVPMAPLAVQAVCARLVHRLNGEGKLLRLAPIAEMPGLPRALPSWLTLSPLGRLRRRPT